MTISHRDGAISGSFLMRLFQHLDALDVLKAQVRCDRLKEYLKQQIICEYFFCEDFDFNEYNKKGLHRQTGN